MHQSIFFYRKEKEKLVGQCSKTVLKPLGGKRGEGRCRRRLKHGEALPKSPAIIDSDSLAFNSVVFLKPM